MTRQHTHLYGLFSTKKSDVGEIFNYCERALVASFEEGEFAEDRLNATLSDLQKFIRERVKLNRFFDPSNPLRGKDADLPSFNQLSVEQHERVKTRAWTTHNTVHPTETHKHVTENFPHNDGLKAAREVMNCLQALSHGWYQKKNGQTIAVAPKEATNQLSPEEFSSIVETALIKALRKLYNSFELPEKRHLVRYAKPTRKMMASEEADRLIRAAREGYNAVALIMQRELDAYKRVSPTPTRPLEDNEAFIAMFDNLIRVVDWKGDKDNKPFNTMRAIENSMGKSELELLSWYYEDLMRLYLELEDVAADNPDKVTLAKDAQNDILSMSGQIFKYLVDKQENKLQLRYQKEKAKLEKKGMHDTPRHRLLETILTTAQQQSVGTEYDPYQNALAFLNDIATLRDKIQGKELLPPFILPNGNKSDFNGLDILWVKARSFGHTSARTEVRQTAEMHRNVYGLFTLLLKEKYNYQEKENAGPDAVLAFILENKNIAKDTLEWLGAIRDRKTLPEDVATILQKNGKSFGFDNPTNPNSSFYDTLATCAMACRMPRDVKAWIISHSFADIGGEGDPTLLLALLAATTDYAEKKAHRVIGDIPIIPLIEELLSLVAKDGDISKTPLSAEIFSNLLSEREGETNPYREHMIQCTRKSKSWKTFDPETKAYRPLTAAEAKIELGLTPKEGDDQKTLLGVQKFMMAGSDLGRGFSPFVHVLRHNASDAIKEAIIDAGFYPKSYLGKGSSVYRMSPNYQKDVTEQGAQLLYNTSEQLAMHAEQAHVLAANPAAKTVTLSEMQKTFTTKIMAGGILEAHERKAFLEFLASNKQIRNNAGNIFRQPDLNRDNPDDQLILDDMLQRCFDASDYYAKRMADGQHTTLDQKKDNAHAPLGTAWSAWYDDYFQYASGMHLVGMFNFSNRPESQVKKDGEVNGHAPTFPPKKPVYKMRAIGNNASLFVTGLNSSLYDGFSVFAGLRDKDSFTLIKPKTVRDEDFRVKDLDKILLEIKRSPALQDTLIRVTKGIATTDLSLAWQWAGYERLENGKVRNKADDKTYSIKELAEHIDQNPPKQMDGVPKHIHMLAHMDVEFQLSLPVVYEIYRNLRGYEVSREERIQLSHVVRNNPNAAVEMLLGPNEKEKVSLKGAPHYESGMKSVIPSALAKEIRESRDGIEGRGGYQHARQTLCDIHRHLMTQAPGKKGKELDATLELAATEAYAPYHTIFSYLEHAETALNDPYINKSKEAAVSA